MMLNCHIEKYHFMCMMPSVPGQNQNIMHEGGKFYRTKLEPLLLRCASFYAGVHNNAGIRRLSAYRMARLFLPIILAMAFGVAKVHAQPSAGVISVALSTRGQQTALLS